MSTMFLATLASAFAFTMATTLVDPGPEVRTFSIDNAHSNVGFKVKHLGILNVNGRFDTYDASLFIDPTDLSTLQASATVNVASIDTGIQRRDDHLRSSDFFDAENYPEMTFVSTDVRNVSGTTFDLVGDLTIRGVTKEIVLNGEFLGTANFMGAERVAIEAMGEINRFDYGLHWDALTEAGGLVVSENVQIILEIQAAVN